MTNKHVGSDFDQWLEEEELLAEAEEGAAKRVIAHQIAEQQGTGNDEERRGSRDTA